MYAQAWKDIAVSANIVPGKGQHKDMLCKVASGGQSRSPQITEI